jgi:hypothetical protein
LVVVMVAPIFCVIVAGAFGLALSISPPTHKNFNDIADKFETDLKGAVKRRRHGIIFITNQRMTRGERQNLVELALKENQECIVYDIERLLGVLDSPEGYGVRISYLRISMSPEEQLAYFANRENMLEGVIANNTEQMKSLAQQLANLGESQLYGSYSKSSRYNGRAIESI